jgi:uncharacterized peroxidase-related enzyme
LIRYPETAKHLTELAQVLLRGPSPLSTGEREIIATYVSKLNRCKFCAGSHGAAAKYLLKDSPLGEVIDDPLKSEKISPKLKALLSIAESVQKGGRSVTDDQVAEARRQGSGDDEIHAAVLIAAAFCMFNRYVDGLATVIPPDSGYPQMGQVMAEQGYVRSRTAPKAR